MHTILGLVLGFSGSIVLILSTTRQPDASILEDAHGGRFGGNVVVLNERLLTRFDHKYGALLLSVGFLLQLSGVFVKGDAERGVWLAVAASILTVAAALMVREAAVYICVTRSFATLLSTLGFVPDETPDDSLLSAIAAGVRCPRHRGENPDQHWDRVKTRIVGLSKSKEA